jgi:hypothetical protein
MDQLEDVYKIKFKNKHLMIYFVWRLVYRLFTMNYFQKEFEPVSCDCNDCECQVPYKLEFGYVTKKEKYLQSIKLSGGYTDQCLGLAAKLCKIYPVENLGIITNGREHQLPLLFLNHKERFKRRDSLKNRFFCHFHPLKDAFYKKLLQIEIDLREDEQDKKDSEKIQVKKIY